MLSYRHRFHAGNFADVFKHAALSRLLALLTRKDKPIAYVDTHAGIGLYDLSHPWSRKNAEHVEGIGRLWRREDTPAALVPWLDVVRAHNPGPALTHYPGSPVLAAALLRPSDRLVLCELNRDDCAALKSCVRRDARAGVHHVDAAQALKAFLPPRERRGLVLVDPPYDRAGDLARLAEALQAAHRRWATGVLAGWYPLMDPRSMARFERALVASGVRPILQLELAVRGAGWRESLRGCGLLVVNPPWEFDAESGHWLEWLWRALAPTEEGGVRVGWLVPE